MNYPESLEYKALEQKIPDLSERSIYTQVYFCINGDQTGNCTNEGDYFIADFVFVKEIKDDITGEVTLNIRVADTKLSSKTNFTDNQKKANEMTDFYVKSLRPKALIKGGIINSLSDGKPVKKTGKIIKIYSNGSGEYTKGNITE